MPDYFKCQSCGHLNWAGHSTCEKCGAPIHAGEKVTMTLREAELTNNPELAAKSSVLAIPREPEEMRVIVTDFDMPFGSMVGFMIKWAIAAIPAFIILFVLSAILAGLFGGLLAFW